MSHSVEKEILRNLCKEVNTRIIVDADLDHELIIVVYGDDLVQSTNLNLMAYYVDINRHGEVEIDGIDEAVPLGDPKMVDKIIDALVEDSEMRIQMADYAKQAMRH